MQFSRVFATDLFSYETLDISLANRGLLVVDGENRDLGGSNGSGKSNLFNCIVWTLYGKTPGYPIGDEVIREDVDHQPIVGSTKGFIEIQRDDDVIQVFRHRQHAEYGNKMLLYVNGQDLTMGSDSETRRKMVEFVGADYEAFTAAIMFPQGEPGFASKTDVGQKTTLDKILRTERFAAAQKRVKEAMAPAMQEMAVTEGKLLILKGQVVEEQSRIVALQQKAAEWEANRQQKVAIVDQEIAQHTIDQPRQQDIDTLQQELEALRARGVTDVDIAAVSQRAEACQRSRDDLRSTFAGLTVRRQSLSIEDAAECADPGVSVVDAEARVAAEARQWHSACAKMPQCISAVQNAADALGKVETQETCGQCGQLLGGTARSTSRATCQQTHIDAQQTATTWQQHVAKTQAALTEAQAQLASALAFEAFRHATDQRHEAAGLDAQLQTLSEKIVAVDAQLTLDRQTYADRVHYDQIVAQRDSLQVKADSWQEVANGLQTHKQALVQEVCPHGALVEECVVNAQRMRDGVVQHEAVLDQTVKQLDVLKFWEGGFGPKGVRSLLLDHVTPFLNERAAVYLDTLSSGRAKMEFHTTRTLKGGDTRDDFHVQVRYQNGAGRYDKLSGGECQRPNLASMFALGDLARARSRSPIALRLLDEPFDNLDALGAEQVVDVLQQHIVPQVGTVLVMTHDDNLKSLIPNRITVVKEDGVSRVVE